MWLAARDCREMCSVVSVVQHALEWHIACFMGAHMRDADHPRILELVLGRVLDLVVFSVEGVRERWSRGGDRMERERTAIVH
jgi:hypothetical protein